MMATGRRDKWITLTEEGPAVADADGSYTTPPRALTPPGAWAAIEPVGARTLERIVAGTVASTATHLVTMPYHPGVSTKTIIHFGAQTFKVAGVTDPEMAHRETLAFCVEHL